MLSALAWEFREISRSSARIQGSRFRASGFFVLSSKSARLGFGVGLSGFRVYGSGFRVQGLGFRL